MSTLKPLHIAVLGSLLAMAAVAHATPSYKLLYAIPGVKPTDATNPGGPGPGTPTDPGTGPGTPDPDDIKLVTAPSVNFGRLAMNTPVQKSVVFQATGTRGVLNLTAAPTVAGVGFSHYAQGTDCTGAELHAGESCTAMVQINPTVAGAMTGTLAVTPAGILDATTIQLQAEAFNPLFLAERAQPLPVTLNKQASFDATVFLKAELPPQEWDPSAVKWEAPVLPTGLTFSAGGVLSGWVGGEARNIPFRVKASYKGNTIEHDYPLSLAFKPLTNITHVSSHPSASTTCAVATGEGLVYCWGARGSGLLGQTGIDNSNGLYAAVQIPGITNAQSVAVNAVAACVVTGIGEVWCWGSNSTNQLGAGAPASTATPVKVAGLAAPVFSLAMSNDTTCVSTIEGHVQCWGRNASGSAGLGHRNVLSSPTLLDNPVGFMSAVSGGTDHFCGVSGLMGMVYCWGDNSRGQLGTGNTSAATGMRPVMEDPEVQLYMVAEISAGAGQTCTSRFIGSGKNVMCWGANDKGQLGNGTNNPSLNTVYVGSSWGSESPAVYAGASGSCALAGNGWRCWGTNTDYVLGISTLGPHYPPTATGLLVGSQDSRLAGGAAHTCVYEIGAGVSCIGTATGGQLGSGTLNGGPVLRPVVF